jgi:DNA replication and repair protein RecF
MTLTRLRLFQFRCHTELVLEPGPGRNGLLGANGAGKTSVLEALYYAARLRSFRTHQVRDLVQWNKDALRVEVTYRTSTEHTLAVTWQKGVRSTEINGQTISKPRDYWGRLPLVLFAPQDRELITGSGKERRAWIDALAAQLDPSFLTVAQDYQRVLLQRNAWLKVPQGDRRTGDILREQLTTYGKQITALRADVSERVGVEWVSAFHDIFQEAEAPTWQYQPSFPLDGAPLWSGVEAREKLLQTTLLGPHRDDWKLQYVDHSLNRFGSEGQQRLAALCLRLAEARLIQKLRGFWPVLLIDDVTPALDAKRRAAFEEQLPPEAQQFIAVPEGSPGKSFPVLWRA